MQKRMRTKEDYDVALNAIDAELDRYTKAAENLEAKRRALQKKKMAKFDPTYRAELARLREANAERKRFITDAAKKFVGKWVFIDDGTYIHISGVDAPTKESSNGAYLGEGYLVFPTHYDMSVVAGTGEVKISNGTSKNHVVYLTLYSSDVLIASKKDVMEDLESSLGDIVSNYKALCKRLRWKPSVR